MSNLWSSRRLHRIVFGVGRYGAGTAPYGWGAKNAGSLGGRSGGRGRAAFPQKNRLLIAESRCMHIEMHSGQKRLVWDMAGLSIWPSTWIHDVKQKNNL